MSKLQKLGFSGPYTANADGSVNGIFNTYPYNIHKDATSEIWVALQSDIADKSVTIAPYIAPLAKPIDPNIEIISQMAKLEATISKRRLREATLTVEGKAWLEEIDSQIAALRAKLV